MEPKAHNFQMGSGISSDFHQVASLGEGRYGTVGCFRVNSKLVAIKTYKNCSDDQISREVDSLNAVRGKCKHLVNIIEYKLIDHVNHLIMEPYLAGPLHLHIQKSVDGRFNPFLTRIYMSELLCGLLHLRDCRVIHRDLKANNILMNSSGHLVICDFGCARILSEDNRAYTIIGSMHCMAPEMMACYLQSKTDCAGYGHSVDWWALGILVYEMLNGSPLSVYDANGCSELNTEEEGEVDSPTIELAEKCRTSIVESNSNALMNNPSDVLESDEILVAHAKDFISQLLTLKPSLRPGFQSTTESLIQQLKAQDYLSDFDFSAVINGISQPGDVQFDRRIGILELCNEFDKPEDKVSEEDQLLFEGF